MLSGAGSRASNSGRPGVLRPPAMPRPRLLLPVLLAVAAALAPAVPAAAADVPTRQTLYRDGPDGRYLLGGTWQFRGSSGGWTNVRVPHSWNATGDTVEDFLKASGTYRKQFRLPGGGTRRDWVLRFESVNYRAYVSFNGRRIGTHQGAYTPFEIRIPHSLLRRGTNTLEVRVSSRHRNQRDFPYQGLATDGEPAGGWWPYGGILREVYLREVDRVDLEDVQVLPELHSVRGPATVTYRARAVNVTRSTQRVSVTATFGGRRTTLGTAILGPGGSRLLTGRLTVPNPRLWQPGSPTLYRATVTARVGARIVRQHTVHTGVRSLRVSSSGTLLLNGKRLNARGMSIHEDWPGEGGAQSNATRDRQLDWVQEAGGTMIRSHYPLHPHVYEEADRRGILVWGEVPFYQVRTIYLDDRIVTRLGDQYLRDNVLANGHHPSIIVWSIANELNAIVGIVQTAWIKHAAAVVRALDDTRLVGIAFAGYPSAGCQKGYRPLDALGVNLYFGWYTGRLGEIADRTRLSDYLDQLHRCYRNKAIFATEWGAEANRDGPVDEKGTYAFQEQWVRDTLSVFDRKPWLAGVLYWTLQEFRIRPEWDGSNPWPTSPLHQKAVIAYDGTKKPAYGVLAEMYRRHRQLGG